MLLQGKKVIVTGGLTGTGRAAVELFVREGATVTSMSRKSPSDAKVVAFMESVNRNGNGKATHMQLDVSKQEDVNRVFQAAAKEMGGLDGLVNCAGTDNSKPTEDLTKEDLYEMLDVHLLGTAFTNSAACKLMKEKGGSIVNNSSGAALVGQPNMAAYSAAKGSILSYTRTIAKEWGQYNIRANAVCITAWTEMTDSTFSKMSSEQVAFIEADWQRSIHLGGKPGTPLQCANTFLYFISDLSDFVTGQTLCVDGGFIMTR